MKNKGFPWTSAGFQADERGSIAILFALSLIPLVMIVGATIDYTRAATMRTRFTRLADTAALAAVRAAALQEADCLAKSSTTGSCTPDNIKKLGEDAGLKFFAADTVFARSGQSSSITLTNNDGSWSATVAYSAQSPAAMTGLIGFSSIPVGRTVTSNISLGSQIYLNIRLLLDRSMSMGIGATADDISRMQDLTGCAFGCHTNGSSSTYYDKPKAQGIRFRIDELRDATTALIATAKTVTASNARTHIQMAAHAFNHQVTTLVDLTTDLNKVASAVKALDLPTSDDGTQTSDAIKWINTKVSGNGNGQKATTPQEIIFIVTDGVDDGIYTGWQGMSAPYGKPLSWWPKYMTKANTGAFPRGACTALKQKNAIVAVVYTTYVPFVGTEQYDKLIGPFASDIAPNLQECATPDYFFTASTPGDIQKGMQQLFNKALAASKLRLTN
ncbi:TadE/TadG family type IV pilus assembly protein [Methylocystis iwaonis]|uniref:TadE/TadG family type IV pilus assembly protein n=1 Tax=Methylocystis iwaonis TaxID=2885079 RepID=UPI002E7B0E6C|nr:pilus assembly protein TadG-related protein [Methylocystis iwaonis]